jgi:16S rRNA (adenine1518-N6/adenine1519-N6)-dimethyltransferase
MYTHQPKKSLGQNFLTSIPARIAIVKGGDVIPSDTILEIGPGRGFLTEELLKTGAHILALEKDRDLIPILQEQFSTQNNLTIQEGDALTFNPFENAITKEGYKIIANIPYYITGAILSHYLSHKNKPVCMVVLVQKEVAERIVARDKKESILSLSVKVYGEPKIIYKVDKGSFNPRPNVDSAVLGIYNIRSNFSNHYHEDIFFKTLHAGFAHKRKLLASNLKNIFKEKDILQIFLSLSIDAKARAEDVTLSTWLQLSQALL